MLGRDAKGLCREFGELRRLRPDCMNPVKRIAFFLPKGEHLTHQQWLDVGERKAAQEDWDTWIMVAYPSGSGEHVIMIASRITYMGKLARETSFDYSKTERLCRQVEQEFGLRRVTSPERTKAGKKVSLWRKQPPME